MKWKCPRDFRLTILLPGFIFMFICRMEAQPLVLLHFESLTINDGLSQGLVSGIIQDKKGFMWFATGDGLNKYDGYKFTVYHHNALDSTSLGDDDLVSVYEDSKERMWVCTRTHGIDLFDRENQRFYHLKHGGENSILSDNTLSIAEDKNGIFWLRTTRGIDRIEMAESKIDKGLNHYKTDQFRFSHFTFDTLYDASKNNTHSPKFFEDSKGNQFIYTCRALYRFVLDNKTQASSLNLLFTYKPPYEYEIGDLIEDTITHTYFLNTAEGLFNFSNPGFTDPQFIYKQPRYYFDVWAMDHAGSLWMAQDDFITRVNKTTHKVEKIREDNSQLALFRSNIYFIYTDRTGVIWMGTAGYGLLKYDPGKENFRSVLPGQNVYRMMEDDSNGVMLLNGCEATIIARDGTISTRQVVDEKVFKTLVNRKPYANYTCYDHQGNFWIGLSDTLIRYNKTTKAIRAYTFKFVNRNDPIQYPFADKNNNLWFATGNYFVKLDSKSGNHWQYKIPVVPLFKDFLQVIYQDKNGLLWLATRQGLFCFDAQKSLWQSWYQNDRDTAALSNNLVLSLCDDPVYPDQYLWVGTKGGGLNRLDKRTGKFVCFTTAHGLPNNVIYGILTDSENLLWLSTNKGLCRFNPYNGHTQNFTIADGLQSNEFNRYAFLKTANNTMFFGGLNGVTYFKPSDIQPLLAPLVMLTDFRLFNKTVDFKQPHSPLKKNICFTDEIVLKHTQNMLTIQFAAMDYRKTGSVQYRYRLEGFDDNWIYTQEAHEATYTNLNPGTYTFTVQASYAADVWGSKGTRLTIRMVPPWWQTWWFYLLSALLVGVIIHLVYRYRINQLLKLERVRNRIARDLHDEIGSSLSTISIYSKVVEEQLHRNDGISHPLLSKINENANEVQEAMNDIVWSINTRNDDFENIINRMREHAIELLEAKYYKLHFQFDDSLKMVKLKMEQRKDFYLIYKEALNNAAKYAEGNNVWITLAPAHEKLVLTIRDDGKGFDKNLLRKNGNGLSNMHSRAKALKGKINIDSETDKGTTVSLSFPGK